MHDDLITELQRTHEPQRSILISLVAGEQCLIASNILSGLNIAIELSSACLISFDIQPVLIDCASCRTIDSFNNAILVDHVSSDNHKTKLHESDELHRTSGNTNTNHNVSDQGGLHQSGDREIAKIVIAANLDLAVNEIQVQLIELLRKNRIFTRDAMYTSPKDLLLIATLSEPSARLSYHLNDMIAISCLDWGGEHVILDGSKQSSVMIPQTVIKDLKADAIRTRLTAEMEAYLHDIVLFMRMSRFVQAGATATATRHLRAISKALSAIHGIDYVTPTMIILATRYIYAHRIVLATAETEKSLQWGSHPQALKGMLEDVTISSVIDDVIASVETPL